MEQRRAQASEALRSAIAGAGVGFVEDEPELLRGHVGTEETLLDLRDPGELQLPSVGQTLGSFSECVTGALEEARAGAVA